MSFLCFAGLGNAASEDNSCSNIMNIVNSPNYADSPCSTPFKKVFIELNYFDLQLGGQPGVQQNFPNSLIRIGLPSHNEFFVEPPNYITQNTYPRQGDTDTSVGLKHTINYNQKWVFALEDIVNFPGGSDAFGSNSWGTTVNGIASYSINDQWNITAMLGIGRTSESKLDGGQSFNSINPDLTISFGPTDAVSFYVEVYGQNKIGVNQGAGFNFDGGVLFLIHPQVIIYFSGGQQLYNYLGDFKHYFNTGIAVML